MTALALTVVLGNQVGTQVTVQELGLSLAKTDSIFRKVLKLGGRMSAQTTVTGKADRVATRIQIVDGFSRMVALAKPKFTISLPTVKYDPKRIAPEFKGDTRKRLELLIRDGFVAPYGPLATGKRIGLTVQEFGDALGMLITRTMELTHMPSSDWSPYLQGPDGPPPPKSGGQLL